MAENLQSPNQAGAVTSEQETTERCKQITPRIMVLSGGYYIDSCLTSREEVGNLLETIRKAAEKGYGILRKGGSAIDAVEATVIVLEDSTYFNAGCGSFLNEEGEIECDAMIMDGNTLNTGAVIAARHFKNPISISRRIMEDSDHCAMTADGALKFAEREKIEVCKPEELIQGRNAVMDFDEYVARLSETQRNKPTENFDPNCNSPNHDTVSAVALDKNGRFACALSTGGMPRKPKGRVGDAPLVGCGGYANEFGAAATSGHGEALMKMTLAREVVYDMEKLGLDAQKSATNAVGKMERRIGGSGSVIAIDSKGNFGKASNLPVMLWAQMADDLIDYNVERKAWFST